jgi:sterol desaturase/sphingolipid hydroxylase (fatty acid hydroxylase superfamily)
MEPIAFILHSVEAISRLHEQHHATPGAYVGTPTWISLLCFGLGGFTSALILFGWNMASGVTTGLALGYIWYLVVHDAVHRRHLKHGSLLYRAKMHHALHHYAKVRGNYGVSNPFWECIFGTFIASSTALYDCGRRGERYFTLSLGACAAPGSATQSDLWPGARIILYCSNLSGH